MCVLWQEHNIQIEMHWYIYYQYRGMGRWENKNLL